MSQCLLTCFGAKGDCHADACLQTVFVDFGLFYFSFFIEEMVVPNKTEYISNKYPLYKVYMGLIVEGTIPTLPPISFDFEKNCEESLFRPSQRKSLDDL